MLGALFNGCGPVEIGELAAFLDLHQCGDTMAKAMKWCGEDTIGNVVKEVADEEL